MSSTRVKLVFERASVKSAEQCWMLIDKSCCKLVRDLEYLIVKKFFVAGYTSLNLYLDDFLLPSEEEIAVIRDNDVIRHSVHSTRVIEEKNQILSNEKSGKTSIMEKVRCSKKRKYEESNDSKTKIKKAKLSPCKKVDNDVQPDSITNKQSSLNIVTKSDLTVTNIALKEKHKGLESVNESSGKDSGAKINANSESRTKQKKLKKRQKKTSIKDKSIAIKWNNFWDKLATNLQPCSSSSGGRKGDLESVKTATNCGKDNGLDFPVTVDKGSVQCHPISKVQEKNDNPLMLSKAKANKESPNKILNGIPHSSQGNHIRFDDEGNTSVDVLNNGMLPIAHPHVLSIRDAASPSLNGTPNLSPIEPNTQSTFRVKKSVNGKDSIEKQQRGKGEKRKDSYTNKSLILESTRAGKETQKSQPVTLNIPEKDYSVYPLLHGPPRVGDTVAYKMIELSQSYTPEISNYKEGKVLSFDSHSKQLRLRLTKESLTKVKGDGNISTKFEIFENNEQDSESATTEEISDEVDMQWTSMIEPRLVDAPATE